MSIAWLSYYTHSLNPESLDADNEHRAFVVYARWRRVLEGAHRLFHDIRTAHRKRVERRALLALSDHLLQDIGMFRTVEDVRIEEVSHPGTLTKTLSISNEVSCSRCVVLPGLQVTTDTRNSVTGDPSSRAA